MAISTPTSDETRNTLHVEEVVGGEVGRREVLAKISAHQNLPVRLADSKGKVRAHFGDL